MSEPTVLKLANHLFLNENTMHISTSSESSNTAAPHSTANIFPCGVEVDSCSARQGEQTDNASTQVGVVSYLIL